MDGIVHPAITSPASAKGLPVGVGIGLKPAFYDALLAVRAPLDFLEIHAENYLGAGGAPHHFLDLLCRDYALSVHGVGLSIGAQGPLNAHHLERIAALLERYPAARFSEHLAWSSHGPVCFHDLLPVACNAATLATVVDHIDQVQNRLKRQILLENPSTYLGFDTSDMFEADFIAAVVRQSGCGLLLDVNNVYVSAVNHQWDADAYLAALPLGAVGEIHLAGFAEDRDAVGDRLLIDAHNNPVDAAVWSLYRSVIAKIGPVPTLIEWDNDVPPLAVLLEQAAQARTIMAVLS